MKCTVRVFAFAMLVAPLLLSESFGADLRQMSRGSAMANRPKMPQGRMVSKHLLLDPLPAGSYTIGVGGYFPTIDSAYRRLEAGGIGGPVTLLLADTLYVAPFPPGDFRLIGPIAGAGPASRITIRPADNVAVTIQGSGTATLTFQNVSYVTLDGTNLQGSTRMKVHTLLNSTFGWNDAIDLWGDCDHNIIQNVTACSDQSVDLSTSVIMLLQDSVAAPDSCLISGVSITSGAVGIYIGAGVYEYSHRPNGNVVRGCHIGSPTDSLISRGITLDGAVATIVENNHVENLKHTLTFAGFTSVLGIECYYGNNTIIRNNVVHGMRGTSAANIHAILGHGDATHIGQGIQIYNNMIYDLQNTVTPGYGSLAGICFWSTNDILVAFNTVWLSGTGSSPYGTDALNFWEGCTNVTVRNNILVNTCRYQAAGGIEQYQITAMFVHGATTFTSDDNDLYVDTSFANNWTVRLGSVGNYRTLGNWQATGRDAQSVSLSPSFRSVTDLHIDTLGIRSQWVPLANKGVAVAGCEYDFDNDNRITGNAPDIGADEFWNRPDLPTSVENAGLNSPTIYSLEQNYPNPFNPTTVVSSQLPVASEVRVVIYDLLGREVAVLVNEKRAAGYYQDSFDATGLASGVYLYQLTAGSFVRTRKMIVVK